MVQMKMNMRQIIFLPKLFLILTVIFIMWFVIFLGGSLVGFFESNWTGISPSLWLMIISFLIGLFIIIDIFIYVTPRFFLTQQHTTYSENLIEFPEVEQRDGKQVYEFTYPVGTRGGVFSKTYVNIGESEIVRIRNQILKKDEIWKK